MKYLTIFTILVFLIGLTAGIMVKEFSQEPDIIKEPEKQIIIKEVPVIEKEQPKEPKEIPSPSDWVKENEIHVLQDKVIIDIENPQWAKFTDTNSMDPLFDSDSNAIEIIPQSTKDLHTGDIASYDAGKQGTIIHRIIETGQDDKGWYAIFKGDNNPNPDPFKVRWEQIRRLVIAIVY